MFLRLHCICLSASLFVYLRRLCYLSTCTVLLYSNYHIHFSSQMATFVHSQIFPSLYHITQRTHSQPPLTSTLQPLDLSPHYANKCNIKSTRWVLSFLLLNFMPN